MSVIRNNGSVGLAVALVFIVPFAFQLIGTTFSHAHPAGTSMATSLDRATSGPEKDISSLCAKPPSLCEAYWSAWAVFTGKVLKIGTHFSAGKRNANTTNPVIVRFSITKRYRGSVKPGATIEAVTQDVRGENEFRQGETYLVYARAGQGSARFTIEECSGTKLLSMAERDVEYINSLAAPDPDLPEVQGGLRGISKPPPSYPQAAKAAGVSGTVYVRITLDETGKVISAQGVCGSTELVTSAEAAIRNWKFEPVHISGKPVKITSIVTANFVR